MSCAAASQLSVHNATTNLHTPFSGGIEEAIVLLKHKILENLLLKRTKKERAADLALPLKTISLGWTTEEELSLYKYTPTAVFIGVKRFKAKLG
ncbi:hypothetical protein KY289_030733 [Solanum tuberosum]|nr:hypothetical protein KY289_030733 [Solanum tuberosum]